MKTFLSHTQIQHNTPKSNLPTTARGRALYTVDWFLNGTPVLRYHGNPCMTLRNSMHR